MQGIGMALSSDTQSGLPVSLLEQFVATPVFAGSSNRSLRNTVDWLERNGLGGFFTRRFFRLYPTLWAVQLIILAVLALHASHYHLPYPHGPAGVVSNALLVHAYVGLPAIEGVCWTLLIEELFYAICAVCAWRRVLDKPATIMLVGLGLALQ